MGLLLLILGLIVFLGAHVFVTLREMRASLIARLGNGYRAHELIRVWTPPAFMRHITVGLMLFAVIFMVAAFIPSHIKAWLKHPMLNSVKTWALAHLLSNGDLGSIVLFGSFLAWAVYARIAVKRREAAGEVTNIRSVDDGWTNDIVAVVLGIFIFLALGYTFHPVMIGVPVFGV